VAVVVALIVVGIGVRLADVQVMRPQRYLAYGAKQYNGFRQLPAWRGAIYDRNGQAFAMSVAEPRIVADPSQVVDPHRAAAALAPLLHVDAPGLEAQLRKRGDRYEILSGDVTRAEADAVMALKLAGITTEDQYVRTNPAGDLAGSVIGRSLADGSVDDTGKQGISGLERQYDALLHGQPGRLWYERDVAGNTIAGGHRKLDPARPGTDLYLTLDEPLQYEAERALADQVTATGAKGATALIMRPSTGEILAMASVAADEDGNVTNTGDNRAVTAVFEPGSTNKVFTVAGAIEEGLVSPTTVLEVPDHLQLYDKDFTDHDPHPTAAWSVTDILVTSSNIGTIKIAQRLGKDGVDRYLRDFGFGATTGLGFPAEEDGIMSPVDRWSGVDIGAIPIGQGISVTALQLLSAYNVMANDGVYVAPKLVRATDRGTGQVGTEPSAGRRVISAATATKMRAMMAKVVSDGTGKRAAVPGYVVAGKTGTARIVQHGGDATDGYRDASGNYRYQSTFVGLVDGADLSILVTVEDPRTSIYGGDVAAPVFAHLAATALRRYQVPPPALADAARREVPELSASAREVDGGDVSGGPRPGAG
jgi:cell division protein FtsI (penicillin-binding protein 3)